MAWSGSPMTQRLTPLAGEQAQQAVLRRVDVLVLVHRDPAVARLGRGQHVGVFFQEADGQEDQVVEIDGIAGAERGVVAGVDACRVCD